MNRHARRGPSAPCLEALEPRALLSGDLAALSPAPTPAQAGTLLVRFASGATAEAIQSDLAAAGAHLVQSFADGGSLVALDQGVDAAGAQQQLRRDPEVAYVESDATFQAQGKSKGLTPNDPTYGLQWGLNQANNVDIDAPQAWARTTGSPSVIVAVLDTGIDLANPEFAGRIWTNADASGNDGYPGDVHGYNFVANDGDVQDDDGHGTHVSGILAAAGNNGLGVAGVDWNAQIMPLKVLDSNGNGSNAAMVAAIDFAVQHGARVINASWGGGPFSQAVSDAISYAGSHGAVFVTAAGNDGNNDDSSPFYPASYHLPNEISVAAVDSTGNLPGFSDFGARTVDLAAPGVNILSTMPGGSYAYMSGTSMATPYVSGVVSLVAGLNPSWNAEQIVQRVESTTKPLAGLAGKTATGGIVDAARAVGVSHPGGTGTGGSQVARLSLKPHATTAKHPALAVASRPGQDGLRHVVRPSLRATNPHPVGPPWSHRRAVLQAGTAHTGLALPSLA